MLFLSFSLFKYWIMFVYLFTYVEQPFLHLWDKANLTMDNLSGVFMGLIRKSFIEKFYTMFIKYYNFYIIINIYIHNINN